MMGPPVKGWKNMGNKDQAFEVRKKPSLVSTLEETEASEGSATVDGGVICLKQDSDKDKWIMLKSDDSRRCDTNQDCKNGLDKIENENCQSKTSSRTTTTTSTITTATTPTTASTTKTTTTTTTTSTTSSFDLPDSTFDTTSDDTSDSQTTSGLEKLKVFDKYEMFLRIRKLIIEDSVFCLQVIPAKIIQIGLDPVIKKDQV